MFQILTAKLKTTKTTGHNTHRLNTNRQDNKAVIGTETSGAKGPRTSKHKMKNQNTTPKAIKTEN